MTLLASRSYDCLVRRQAERPCRRTNEVSILEVEAVQFVTGLLCIHNILVDDEGGALGVVCDSLSDLAV